MTALVAMLPKGGVVMIPLAASTAGSEDDHVNVAPNPASHRGALPASGRSGHKARQRRAGRSAWTR
jgi:hypothetical protein